MEQELAVRSLSQSLTSHNARVCKLTRMQEKVRNKPGCQVSLRNALKLYQNYKAMESCCQSLLTALDAVQARCFSESPVLFVARVGEQYLLVERFSDGTFADYFPAGSSSAANRHCYSAKEASVFCAIEDEVAAEYRTKQPVLALYPASNRMLPAQVSSPPSRRRKTQDYLVKFPSDAHSVPCAPRFVIDPSNVHI